jgi:methionine aminotransferase
MPSYNSIIYSKLPRVGESIFSEMSNLAIKHNALNLSQGFPDFAVDPKLISLVHQKMQAGLNQYAPSYGVPLLREKIAQKISDLYGVSYNPDTEITITAGATQGLYTAISAFIREDDEALIFEPAYDSYVPAIKANGGLAVYAELEPDTFTYDWTKIKRAITQQTKVIILNSPHNPTGNLLTEYDLERLENLVDGSDIIIISDEVYEHMTFDGKKHISPISRPKLAERTIVVSSFGKIWHNTGWKVGYVYGPKELIREVRKLHQFMVFSVSTPIQHAYADYIDNKDSYLQLADFYQQKRDAFLKMIQDSRFTFKPTEGSFFQLLNYEGISDLDDETFAQNLVKLNGIATIPLSPFYHLKTKGKNIRLCFAKTDETLEKAAEILCKI